VERSQRKPLAKLAWQMGLPAPAAGNALNFCLYSCKKTTVVHKLYYINHEGRVYFVNWLLNGVHAGEINPTLIPCNEEVWFHFSGHMNSENKINWSVQNHMLIHEVPLHDDNVDVWCAMSATKVIGPIFSGTVKSC